MDGEVNAAYIRQLDAWVTAWKQKTQLPQAALGRYTVHFDFGDKYRCINLPEYTVSRTLNNRPLSRVDGKYNLLMILGVLYMTDVIHSEEKIREFLETNHIQIPTGTTWEDIWREIEAGAERGRREVSKPKPHPFPRVGHLSWVVVLALLYGAVCGGLGLGLLARRQAPPVSSSPSGIVNYFNGWCAATPLRFSPEPTAPYYLYVSGQAQVSDFTQHPYFAYFNETYITEVILHLDGFDQDTQQWRFRLDNNWVSQHANWKTSTLWHINFEC